LEEHVDEPDPTRLGERARVQSIVNARLMLPKLVSLDHASDYLGKTTIASPDLPWPTVHGISTWGLAEAVAKEKAENIHLQRPAIQKLGRKGLRSLIHRIFEDLSNGAYDAGAVADAFGLSPATLSRFAGCRWSTRANSTMGVPDLFLNTAHTLARVPTFVQAAKAAGVWSGIEEIRCLRKEEWGTGHVK
jgi:hypothetical protein